MVRSRTLHPRHAPGGSVDGAARRQTKNAATAITTTKTETAELAKIAEKDFVCVLRVLCGCFFTLLRRDSQAPHARPGEPHPELDIVRLGSERHDVLAHQLRGAAL